MSTQIIKMFEESNNRMNKIMKNDFDINQVGAAQREFEGQIKLLNAIVSAFGVQSKNKRARLGLEKMNIMDETTAVDVGLGLPDEQMVRCPEKNNGLITRAECLDYSGKEKHYNDCRDCECFTTTRDKLVGPKLHTA